MRSSILEAMEGTSEQLMDKITTDNHVSVETITVAISEKAKRDTQFFEKWAK